MSHSRRCQKSRLSFIGRLIWRLKRKKYIVEVSASDLIEGDKIILFGRHWISKKEVGTIEPIKIFTEPHYIYVDVDIFDPEGVLIDRLKIDEKVFIRTRQ